MCRLNNCCCCCSLESGGYIIGWFNAIVSFLAMIGLIALLSIMLITGQNDDNVTKIIEENNVGGYVTLIIVYSVFILYSFIVFMASIMLIRGIRKRDHGPMVLFLILMGIGVVLQFLQVLAGGWSTLISGAIAACISLYFFSVIYSLYRKIKDENMGRPYA